jgi:type VI secretion system protein VasJ
MSTATNTLLTPAAGTAANDPRYQEIRLELDKQNSPSGIAVDWRTVAKLGAELTREVGKDLNILAFLALARAQLRDLPGLVETLRALASIILAPPPGPTPVKPTARASALEYLLTRLRAELPALPTTPAAAPHIHALHDALRELGVNSREALGDLCPGFSSTQRVLETLRADLPEPPTDQTPAPESPPEPEPTATLPIAAPPITEQPPADSPATPAWHAELAQYLTPLTGDPGGTDPASAPAFDDARTEILKLGALSSQAVDWACVEARTTTLLRDHSRDLRVTAWFTLARFHRGGLHGLATGLHLYAAILEQFDVHPRKPKVRRDTSDWFIRQAAAALTSVQSPELREPPLRELEAAQLHLAAALQLRLDPDVPSLRPLRDALARALTNLPPPPIKPPVPTDSSAHNPERPNPPEPALELKTPTKPDPTNSESRAPNPSQPDPATSESRPPNSQRPDPANSESRPPNPSKPDPTTPGPRPERLGDQPAAPAAPADLTRLDNFLDTTGDALQSTARALRELSPTDPRAYRLLRIGLWLGRSAPTPRPDGTTAIPGLGDCDREQLAELHQHARWPGLLTRCEDLLARHCFALDLQRLAAAALTGLGPDYAPAALSLRAELRALLTCFPTLPDLRTSDGLPLADPATQRWLADEVLPRSAPACLATITASAATIDPTFWAELPARLTGPDRHTALAEAQTKIATCPSGQLRFTWRLALADACERAGTIPLATLLLTGLTQELEVNDLARWDPPLAAQCLAAAARNHRQRGAEAEAHAALTRLARLDPAAAWA